MTKYFTTKGRINRSEFLVLSVIILLLEVVLFQATKVERELHMVIMILVFTVYLMQCTKRYHDLNWPGIVGFYWCFIPVINFFCFFQLYFFEGNTGVNKYGPPSKFKLFKAIRKKS